MRSEPISDPGGFNGACEMDVGLNGSQIAPLSQSCRGGEFEGNETCEDRRFIDHRPPRTPPKMALPKVIQIMVMPV